MTSPQSTGREEQTQPVSARPPPPAVGDEPLATRVASESTAKGEEKQTHEGPEVDETPLDPAEHIEAHILPRLDPAVVDYLVRVVFKNALAQDVTIEQVREKPERFRSALAMDTSGEPRVADHQVTSKDGAQIPVRVYHPDPAAHGSGPYPVHLNFHGRYHTCWYPEGHTLTEPGGGFVLGDLWSDGQICLSMRTAGVVVVDVNYRHCPGMLLLVLLTCSCTHGDRGTVRQVL